MVIRGERHPNSPQRTGGEDQVTNLPLLHQVGDLCVPFRVSYDVIGQSHDSKHEVGQFVDIDYGDVSVNYCVEAFGVLNEDQNTP